MTDQAMFIALHGFDEKKGRNGDPGSDGILLRAYCELSTTQSGRLHDDIHQALNIRPSNLSICHTVLVIYPLGLYHVAMFSSWFCRLSVVPGVGFRINSTLCTSRIGSED